MVVLLLAVVVVAAAVVIAVLVFVVVVAVAVVAAAAVVVLLPHDNEFHICPCRACPQEVSDAISYVWKTSATAGPGGDGDRELAGGR